MKSLSHKKIEKVTELIAHIQRAGYFCWWHGVISLSGAYKRLEKVSNGHTRRFHEHKLAIAGTTLCIMAKISAHAIFFKSKRPHGQI